jgi:hypothetical protein
MSAPVSNREFLGLQPLDCDIDGPVKLLVIHVGGF